MTATLLLGDALTVLRTLPDRAARCCVTSPPYWGLRDYGVAGQLGLEATPAEYVARMVEVFREVRRVLADDGTLWLNLGDSYARAPEKGGSGPNGKHDFIPDYGSARKFMAESAKAGSSDGAVGPADRPGTRAGGKPKDLIGIPWRVAFALQADGWYLRSDIIWHKPNPMPESVRDRPTKAHEYLFLLTKQERYYYDAAALAEPVQPDTDARYERGRSPNHKWADGGPGNQTLARSLEHMKRSGNKIRKTGADRGRPGSHLGGSVPWEGVTRNARSVWTIATEPYKGAHFATFPSELARRCLLAGSQPGDVVLDPFGGSGTVAQVATGNGRAAIHIDLNPAYIELARQRIGPMLVASSA